MAQCFTEDEFADPAEFMRLLL